MLTPSSNTCVEPITTAMLRQLESQVRDFSERYPWISTELGQPLGAHARLLALLSEIFPGEDDQNRLLWKTPAGLLGFEPLGMRVLE